MAESWRVMTGATAFEAFVRKHQDMVFGIAVRLLGDESEAQDVSQTVFLKAFERFDHLGKTPSAGGWLRTVTTNLCLNHLSRFRARWHLFSQRRPGESETEPSYEERLVARGSQEADLEASRRACPAGEGPPPPAAASAGAPGAVSFRAAKLR